MNKFGFIPIAEPDLTNIERAYLNEAFDSNWISSSGKFVDQFELEWAKICQTGYSLSVSNGTVAIQLILAALGIGPGDEVIVPSLTFVASANAVKYVGATPVFADSTLNTWCIDPNSVEKLITPRTRAIMAVHLYGNPCDMKTLSRICEDRGVHLIEDAAEAPFGEIDGRRIGAFGIAASFSFYGNKILTSGEGGAVVTSDLVLYQKMKLLRGQGMDPKIRYFFPEIGYNFRLTNMQCALLCGQIERQHEILVARREVFRIYDEYLLGHPKLQFQQVISGHIRSPWLYTCLVKVGGRYLRDKLMENLSELGIETRPVFIPIHQLPPYISASQSELPVADFLGNSGISLPTSSVIDSRKIEYVAKNFLRLLEED